MPIRLLIVDHEKDNKIVFSDGLRRRGYEVTTYADPVRALREFHKDAYDIVILDYKMPVLDGFALYEEMMAIDSKPAYCFITASEDLPRTGQTPKPELRERHFLHKPITINQLVARLESVLSSKDADVV